MTERVAFEGVDKIYRLGAERINLRAAVPGRLGRRPPVDGHAALKNVSLSVHDGESVGVIGRNGAGKSTLLKLVARVIAPTRGSVSTRGAVASLIELGAGFHPDLTGNENVRFASILLGMSSYELSRRFDDIVAFAGIERFMDTPIKRYSSGMLARLGFAVASHLDADVLAVDEVLSVGDSEFQSQCHQRVGELRRSGCAILFVTHNTWVVPQVCQRVIWLDLGQIVDDGDPEEVLMRYRASTLERDQTHEFAQSSTVEIESASVTPPAISPHESITVEALIRVDQPIDGARVLFAVIRPGGLFCGGLDVPGSESALRTAGVYKLRGVIDSLPLQPGPYRIWVAVVEESRGPVFHSGVIRDIAVIGDPLPPSTYGVISLEGDWSVETFEQH